MSVTDYELIKLATRAAGIDLCNADWGGAKDGFYWVNQNKTPSVKYWNPLTDDGDALRLAVKLDIDIYQADNEGPSVYAGYWHKRERRDVNRLFCIESTTQDPYAATRRAIVRAAAEIGKQRGEV